MGLQESGTTIALFEDRPVEPATPRLDIKSRDVSLPLKEFPPPAGAEAEAEALRQELYRLRAEGTTDQVRAATARATQATMRSDRAKLFHGKTHLNLRLQAIGIGDIALVSIQGEPFAEIGFEIKKRSPFPHTLFSGYSNGAFGYLPIRAAYEEGGYEVETSPFSPDAAEILIEQALQVLDALWAEKAAKTASS